MYDTIESTCEVAGSSHLSSALARSATSGKRRRVALEPLDQLGKSLEAPLGDDKSLGADLHHDLPHAAQHHTTQAR